MIISTIFLFLIGTISYSAVIGMNMPYEPVRITVIEDLNGNNGVVRLRPDAEKQPSNLLQGANFFFNPQLLLSLDMATGDIESDMTSQKNNISKTEAPELTTDNNESVEITTKEQSPTTNENAGDELPEVPSTPPPNIQLPPLPEAPILPPLLLPKLPKSIIIEQISKPKPSFVEAITIKEDIMPTIIPKPPKLFGLVTSVSLLKDKCKLCSDLAARPMENKVPIGLQELPQFLPNVPSVKPNVVLLPSISELPLVSIPKLTLDLIINEKTKVNTQYLYPTASAHNIIAQRIVPNMILSENAPRHLKLISVPAVPNPQ